MSFFFPAILKFGIHESALTLFRLDDQTRQDFFEMQKDALVGRQDVVIIDDLIATGGSAKAAGDLVQKLGGTVLQYMFIVELTGQRGRDVLEGSGDVWSLIQF